MAVIVDQKPLGGGSHSTVGTVTDIAPALRLMFSRFGKPDVGLEYLTLGQPLSTLSGGECQRIKLASELHKKGSIYVLDEPTTGLHISDITRLHRLIDRLVEDGNTVITIEHNVNVIRQADWIIDLGPEGGDKGGNIMFEGTPRELLSAKHSLMSKYL